MKTPEQIIEYIISIMNEIEVRPAMFGSSQLEIHMQYINLLGFYAFITEKKFDLFECDVIIAKKIGKDLINTSLPGYKLDDIKFMSCLKMYREIFEENKNGKS